MPTPTDRRRALRTLAAFGMTAGAGLCATPAQAQEESALQRVKRTGRLTVAIYHDLPPFHVKGKGIGVDLGAALAAKLGVQLSLLPFAAGENMEDDLRNMVWRGHYLGFGPADVLLHVPVEPAFMAANPRVRVFGPYWRERVVMARDLSKLPELDSLDPLVGKPVAVPGSSLAAWLLLGADGGKLRDSLITKLADGFEAADRLKKGEAVAAAGVRSELEAALAGDKRYAITPLPMPRHPRDGWALGMAVKKDAVDLSEALARALNELAAAGELEKLFAAGGLRWTPV
jgi:ABC-type amino acid transport substrate-binding protein